VNTLKKETLEEAAEAALMQIKQKKYADSS